MWSLHLDKHMIRNQRGLQRVVLVSSILPMLDMVDWHSTAILASFWNAPSHTAEPRSSLAALIMYVSWVSTLWGCLLRLESAGRGSVGPLGLCFGCGCCQEGHGEWEVLPQEWLRCGHWPPRVGGHHGHPGLGSLFGRHSFGGWGSRASQRACL